MVVETERQEQRQRLTLLMRIDHADMEASCTSR
jgi:hypothetical protein